MFFTKKYHTLTITNLYFASLTKKVVFTYHDVDKIDEILDWIYESGRWSTSFYIDINDNKLPLKSLLSFYNKNPNNEIIESVPFGITHVFELYHHLKEKGEF